MALIAAAPLISANELKPEADIERLENHDSVLGYANLGSKLRAMLGLFLLSLDAGDAGAGASAETLAWVAPFPCVVRYAQVGARTAAGATGTAQLQKALAATPTTWAGMLSADGVSAAAVDVKTAVGVMQSSGVLSGQATLAAGDRLRGQVSSGSGGTLTGGKLLAWVERL